jgi:hypothetical protein
MRFMILALLVFAASTGDALAYVGPGVGLGIIGAIFGTILAVLLAIVGVIWYPVKRLLRRTKAAAGSPPQAPPVDQDGKPPG